MDRDYYRREEFSSGLKRHGFAVSFDRPRNPKEGDVLLIWNRSRANTKTADEFEAAGGIVIVAENGYLGQPQGGGKFYALALDHHNGAGRWFVGDEARFEIPEEPWRKKGDHILVLPQRGIGAPRVRMPSAWKTDIMKRLAQITDRPIRLRLHPGHKKTDPKPDLINCHAAVTWGSGAGIKAIQAGVPVFHELGPWIGHCAARRLADDLEVCHTPDRSELWRRISWAQWSLAEISSGQGFDRLLHEKDCNLFRAIKSAI
jgi:hypothetical protein